MKDTIKKAQRQLARILRIDEKKRHLAQLEQKMQTEGFWQDREQARQISQEYAQIQELISLWQNAKTISDIAKLKRQALFAGEHDFSGAICSVHAGAGGTEAQDWALMVKEMLEKFARKMGWQTEEISESRGEQAGIKSTTFRVIGARAYGWLKSEAGVHRLVRMSPFDADKARHTSFCLVEVVPQLSTADELKIPDKDLRVDTFRSSGHGGQNVNKLETAVRLTHLPTGISVTVQKERSQGRNRQLALTILASRLKQLMDQQEKDKLDELRGKHQEMAWGNQIRSYVLAPYQQVKDHRTKITSPNPRAVLSGDLKKFALAYLTQTAVAGN